MQIEASSSSSTTISVLTKRPVTSPALPKIDEYESFKITRSLTSLQETRVEPFNQAIADLRKQASNLSIDA